MSLRYQASKQQLEFCSYFYCTCFKGASAHLDAEGESGAHFGGDDVGLRDVLLDFVDRVHQRLPRRRHARAAVVAGALRGKLPEGMRVGELALLLRAQRLGEVQAKHAARPKDDAVEVLQWPGGGKKKQTIEIGRFYDTCLMPRKCQSGEVLSDLAYNTLIFFFKKQITSN